MLVVHVPAFHLNLPKPLLTARGFQHLGVRQRRVLLLLDVSGSLKSHSPDFLRFAHALVHGGERVEVFTFGTRLTRITPALRPRDRDMALARAAAAVEDWDGRLKGK